MDTLGSSSSSLGRNMLGTSSLMPDYLSHFGLSSDPFALAEFYSGAGRQSLIENLHHQVLFGAGLLVVGAAEGVGKTSLCSQLQKSFDDAPVNVCSMRLQAGVSLQSFVAELALMLGMSSLASVPVGQALSELRRYLQVRREDGALSVLLIDDAHHLDDQSLATLVGLLQGQAELDRNVCVVLFAEPNFLGRLAVTDIGDLLLHDILLEAFNLDDLRAYLQWCFKCVGGDGEFPYQDSDIETWLLESAGNLTHIHRLAQQWLLESVTRVEASHEFIMSDNMARENSRFGGLKQLPLLHIGAIALLSGVLLLAYIFRGDAEAPISVGPVEKVQVKPMSLGRGAVAVDAWRLRADKVSVEEALSAVEKLALAEQMMGQNPAAKQAAIDSVKEAQVGAEPLRASTAVASPLGELVATVQVLGDGEVQGSEALAVDGVEQIAEEKPVAVEMSVPSFFSDEKKLLVLNKQQYVLQVMAASSQASVEKFAAEQPNRKNLFVFSSQRQGAAWYVVVEGPHSSVEAARAAVIRLPSRQRKAGPWPRSLADIQSKIRENSRI